MDADGYAGSVQRRKAERNIRHAFNASWALRTRHAQRGLSVDFCAGGERGREGGREGGGTTAAAAAALSPKVAEEQILTLKLSVPHAHSGLIIPVCAFHFLTLPSPAIMFHEGFYVSRVLFI